MMKNLILAVSILTFESSSKADIVDGSFENFPVPPESSSVFTNSYSSHWKSTTDQIEIWSDLYRGVPAVHGGKFLMIPGEVGIYQTFELSNINSFQWSFAHRPRSGWDILEVSFTDLGTDKIYGTSDDVLLSQQEYKELLPFWSIRTGSLTPITENLRIDFYSKLTNSGQNGNNLIGNYVDSVNVIPAPSVLILFSAFIGLFPRVRRK